MKYLLTLLFLFSSLAFGNLDREIQLVKKYKDQIVLIAGDGGLGSAFPVKIGKSLTLISAEHVCVNAKKDEKGKRYMDGYWNKKKYKLYITKESSYSDMCALQYPKGIKPLKLAKEWKPYEQYVAIGYAVNHEKPYRPISFSGYGINRSTSEDIRRLDPIRCERLKDKGFKVDYIDSPMPLPGMFPIKMPICKRTFPVLDTTINGIGGMSGGPTINLKGEVIGINYATSSRQHVLSLVPYDEIEKFYFTFTK